MKSIKSKLILGGCLLSIIGLIIAIGFSYNTSQKILNEVKSAESLNAAKINAEQMNGWMMSQGKMVTEMVNDIENIGNLDEAHLMTLFSEKMKDNPYIISFYIGFSDKRTVFGDAWVPGADYDCTQRDWYKAAIEKNGLAYTAPYYDGSVKKVVITVAKPVVVGGKTVGVAAADITVGFLTELVATAKAGEGSYGFLLDADKAIVVHQNEAFMPTEDALTPFMEAGEKVYGDLGDAMGQATILKHKDYDGKEKWFAFAPMNENGWTFGFAIPTEVFDAPMKKLITGFVTAVVITLALTVVITVIWANGFVKPLINITNHMHVFAKGDLTKRVEVKSEDEIGQLGQSYNETINDLGQLIQNIKGVTGELTFASQNLAATSEETSASADEVAKTVEEIAKGAQEQAQDAERGATIGKSLSDKFVALSENTSSMLQAAKSLNDANTSGLGAVDSLKAKTESTNAANERIQLVINQLNEKTQQIGAILDSISAISVQTNLLALNASIEAARAGEHGRGFAVVAEEIRKLAEESARAADEVRDIVTNIQADSVKSTESMAELSSIAEEQNGAVENVLHSFDAISSSYAMIAAKIKVMGDSVESLTHDKDAIITSIENISAVSEETAAASEEVTASMDQQVMAVEEVARSAERLNEISHRLNQEINKFIL